MYVSYIRFLNILKENQNSAEEASKYLDSCRNDMARTDLGMELVTNNFTNKKYLKGNQYLFSNGILNTEFASNVDRYVIFKNE